VTAEAHHQRGVVLWQAGDHAGALAHVGEAIRLAPGIAAYRNTAGIVLASLGDARAAAPWIRSALALTPEDTATWTNYGHVRRAEGQPQPALRAYARALSIDPSAEPPRTPMAELLIAAGAGHAAARLHRRALALAPGSADAWRALGGTHRRSDGAAAAATLQRAGILAPASPEAVNDLGIVLFEQNRLEPALRAFDAALGRNPHHVGAWTNSALALQRLGRDEEAYARYARALALQPSLAEAHGNLAGLDQGAFDHASALRRLRRAVHIKPTPALHSSLILALSTADDISNDALFAECRRWEALHARPHYASPRPAAIDTPPGRKLRIGWCSADFSDHPVARNVIGLLEHRDRSRFDAIVYADLRMPDATTDRFRRTADVWREIAGMSDAAVADSIRADRVDILVMVAGHTLHNRIGVAAFRPAPIQVSFLDITSSGMEAVDYWLTDPILHPPQTTERFTESLLRLPCLYLQEWPGQAPDVSPPPSAATGRIVFGSMNGPRKYNAAVFATWSRILAAVPGSSLTLKYVNDYASPRRRALVRSAFARNGIDPGRIAFVIGRLERGAHLAALHDVDIALDPFPFNGSTTSYEALWMGVPVVTLAGDRFVGRVGASFLTHIGLPDLVAADLDQYVDIAVRLAADPARLAGLRATLRERVAGSRLLDAPGHARALEAAFEKIWMAR